MNAALTGGLKSSPEPWHLRGQLRLALGSKDEAVADLQKALQLYRKGVADEDERGECLFQLACVSALLNGLAAAHDFLKEAIALEPSFRKRAREDADLAGLR